MHRLWLRRFGANRPPARIGKRLLAPLAALAGVLLCDQQPLFAMARETSAVALKKLSIEELMNIEVTSVSRTVERLSGAPAAITVVTNEDIRRSGATSIPELLRGVPGIHVARRNANSWALSSRGFSSINSEKLLVLSDTRSIYTPLYSGVFWDVQDYLLEDIERIEVIRGPGAALWGSNAVNGVINITTQMAKDTQGLYLAAGGGSEERVIASARYGGRLSERGFFRVFGKYSDRDGTFHSGAQSDDDWQIAHFGFRGDWESSTGDLLTLQGGYYEGDVGQIAPAVTIIGRPGPQGELDVGVSGGNVLGRWQHWIDEQSELSVRLYYDRTHRNDPTYIDNLDTVDLDVQHGFTLAERHEILWGANYRFTNNRNEGKGLFALSPGDSRDTVISAFVQDRVAFFASFHATLGTKLEHNDFSGYEFQPSLRLAWDISPVQTLWGAASRAARVPTRLERDIAIDLADPDSNPIPRLLGNDEFDSEELLAYELGYRWQPLSVLSMDLAVFHHRYEGLASLEVGTPFIDPSDGRIVIPVTSRNLTDGRSQGLEALFTYSPHDRWRVSASYSYIDLSLDPRGEDLNRGRFLEGATPRHQFSLRSYLDLPGDLELDAHFRHLADIRRIPDIVTGEGIRGYSELDVRLGWQATDRLEISVVGRNLLHERHTEFGAPAARGEIERSVYAKLAWGF